MRNSKVINGNKIAIVKPSVFESEDNSLILTFELQVPRNIFEIKMVIEEGQPADVINQDSFADVYDYLDTFIRSRDIDRFMDFIDSTAERIVEKMINKEVK